MNKATTGLALAAFYIVITAGNADARALRLDGSIDVCDVGTFAGDFSNDGAVQLDIGTWNGDFSMGTTCHVIQSPLATFNPFSINLFGTSYSSLYFNENGILSFGSAVTDSPSTSLLNLGVAAIAPFFADAGFVSTEIGYSNIGLGEFWLTYFTVLENGNSDPNRRNTFQVGIFDQGNGDFDLQLNYNDIAWDPGQIGFTDGLGNGWVLPGSGVAGALIGNPDALGGPDCGPLSVACNSLNLALDNAGGQGTVITEGRYNIQFRNGQPLGLANTVPEPPTLLLLAFGLVIGGRLARRSR